ncbi:MAG: threonine ammonia-lyase [Alphaproteobacteria bacterium]
MNRAAAAGLPVSLQDIKAAASVIASAVAPTPAHRSRTLSEIAGCEIFLKFENLHFTASFKERGALNKLSSLPEAERERGIVAMSAGNHAQGVAYHAGRLKIPATIVMPLGTPFNKVKHTRDFGATVELAGANFSEAIHYAHKIEKERNLVMVHPFEDPRIIAGQGTLALEFLAQAQELDTLVVPIGGGGLISGISIAAKALKPAIAIFGVQTKFYPAMYGAVKGEQVTCGGQSIAEGIAVKEPGQMTRAIVAALVEDILLVSEPEIERSIVTLLEVEKTVAEGAGAAAFAAVLANRRKFHGRKVGVVISGGNIDMRLLSNVILRELGREGRILSLSIAIEDRPGLLARVATLISEAGGNILDVSHNRLFNNLSARSAELGMVIEARDVEHAGDIRKKLEEAGFAVREQRVWS